MATELLTSSLLPVPHGFATRAGGVSEGAFASLNLGFSTGDERARVEENLRRFAAAAGAPLGALCRVSQVHGDRVLEARAEEGSDGLRPTEGEADGLWTQAPGTWVAVGTADCVPVLLVDPDGQRVAAVHSGWRGTDAEISVRAVELLVARGARPERLLAAVGPAIQRCCYEVSDELGQRFAARFGDEVVSRDAARPHLDLSRAVRLSLVRAGLKAGHVDVLQACTACEPGRFFSHRRDAGRTGRHLSYVLHRF
ncbi:peptidoglycan editing factor PgeF [Myxococcus stipitatus]|uniref:peptidoglycan editing factor PgeF n=1 Tax=Myxococcus stipitatus TaxID=83455 RepID=UPI001F30E9A9|nr:peptidoglycan editing factor PgeF [Myxococcus stipitatus]MCE9667269.1 peptidoglycan editing factor PgeF [Myxococcus stipitatus]